jgi:hypothetical protein
MASPGRRNGPCVDEVIFPGGIYDPLSYFHILPDGTTWLGSDILIDGSSDRQVKLPASSTNRKPEWSVAHAPDGSIWLVTTDVHPRADDRCPRKRDLDKRDLDGGEVNCVAADGLYVITPEAVAATE